MRSLETRTPVPLEAKALENIDKLDWLIWQISLEFKSQGRQGGREVVIE